MKNSGYIILVFCIFAKASPLTAQDKTFESLFKVAFECGDCTDSLQIAQYTAAIDYGTSDPLDFKNFTNALINRGTLYSESGNYKAAIGDFKHALEIDPDTRNVWQRLGTAYLKAEDYTRAIDAYDLYIRYLETEKQKILAEFPLKNDSTADLSANNSNRHMRKNAIMDLSPLYARAYNNRGIAKSHLKNRSGACADFRKAYDFGMTELKKFIEKYCE